MRLLTGFLRKYPYWIPAVLSILIAAYLRGRTCKPPETLFANNWAFKLRHLVEPFWPDIYRFRDLKLVPNLGDWLSFLVHLFCAFGIPLAFGALACGLMLAWIRKHPQDPWR